MNFRNTRKDTFLNSFPDVAFNSSNCNHAARCKFNFSYFDSSQPAGQDFSEWTHEQLYKLLVKIKEYGKHPLQYWLTQRCGAGGLKVLEIYGGFPTRSDFKKPKHVPSDVRWARFRLEGDMRLCGFLIPDDLDGTKSKNDEYPFDGNTFYVVFLDNSHAFYKMER